MRHAAAAVIAAWAFAAPPALAGEPANQPNAREILERAVDAARSITRARFSISSDDEREYNVRTVWDTLNECWIIRESESVRFRVETRTTIFEGTDQDPMIRSVVKQLAVGDSVAGNVHTLHDSRWLPPIVHPAGPQRNQTPYDLWALGLSEHISFALPFLDPEGYFYGFPHDKAEYAGSQAVDGEPCHVIHAKQAPRLTLWISERDAILRRFKLHNKAFGGGERTIESTLTLLDTDSEFSDALFDPTKMELPPFPDLVAEINKQSQESSDTQDARPE